MNAQGEDLVAGTSTPRDISALAVEMPAVYRELLEVAGRLERHYRDAQDVEFTVEQGRLYILQTRTAQGTANAAGNCDAENSTRDPCPRGAKCQLAGLEHDRHSNS